MFCLSTLSFMFLHALMIDDCFIRAEIIIRRFPTLNLQSLLLLIIENNLLNFLPHFKSQQQKAKVKILETFDESKV